MRFFNDSKNWLVRKTRQNLINFEYSIKVKWSPLRLNLCLVMKEFGGNHTEWCTVSDCAQANESKWGPLGVWMGALLAFGIRSKWQWRVEGRGENGRSFGRDDRRRSKFGRALSVPELHGLVVSLFLIRDETGLDPAGRALGGGDRRGSRRHLRHSLPDVALRHWRLWRQSGHPRHDWSRRRFPGRFSVRLPLHSHFYF